MTSRTLATICLFGLAPLGTGCFGLLFPKPSQTPASTAAAPRRGADTAPVASAPAPYPSPATASTSPAMATVVAPAAPLPTVEAVLGFDADGAHDLAKVAAAFRSPEQPYLAQTRDTIRTTPFRQIANRHEKVNCEPVGRAFDDRIVCAGHISYEGVFFHPDVAYVSQPKERRGLIIPARSVVLRWSRGAGERVVLVTPDGVPFHASESDLEAFDASTATLPEGPSRYDLTIDEIAWLADEGQIPASLSDRVARIRAAHWACQDRFYAEAEKEESRLFVADLQESTRSNRIDAAYDRAYVRTLKECRKHSLKLKDVLVDGEAAHRSARQRLLNDVRAHRGDLRTGTSST